MKTKAIQQKQQDYIYEIQTNYRKETNYNTKENTIKKYQTVFNNFNNYLSLNNIQSITAINIKKIYIDYKKYLNQDYKTKQNKLLSINTINQYMIIITKFLKTECNFNINNDWYKMQKIKKKDYNYLTTQQYNILIEHLSKQHKSTTNNNRKQSLHTTIIMIKLLFNTGLRIHEATKIKINDIRNLEKDNNNTYQLSIIGKGNKERKILISSKLFDDLTEYINTTAKNNKIYLFENRDTQKQTSIRNLRYKICRVAKNLDKELNINPDNANSYTNCLKPHSLRHSFAVKSLEKGMNINVLQKLLGHENITTTQIYTMINDNNLSDAAAMYLD